jgi:Na+/proline symporter
MIGSVLLAVIMYFDASSGEGMLAKLQASPHFTDATLNIVPSFSTWDVTAFTFLMYVGFVWFLNFPTAGYHVQRLLSTRDENQAMRAFLWFNYANYVLRTWPWVVVGVLGLIYYPHASGAESESTYAMAVADFLPAGLKGLMVAAFLAAYMSTISTHLNWGASYLVNDVYQAYINKNASPVQVVVISRVCLVLLAALAAVVATRLTRMIDAYKFLYMLWAGVGTVLVARWYWWRVTPVAELIAIGATALFTWMLYAPVHHLPGAARWIESMGLAIPAQAEAASTFVIHEFLKLIQIEPDAGGMAVFCIRVFVITILTLAIWVPYVLLTSRRPTDAARQFYARLRIASAGWKRVELETRLPMAGGEFRLNLTCWVVTCGSLYGLLIGLGSLLFHQWNAALFWLMVAAACSFLLVRLLKVRNRIGASISVRPAIT